MTKMNSTNGFNLNTEAIDALISQGHKLVVVDRTPRWVLAASNFFWLTCQCAYIGFWAAVFTILGGMLLR
jgi:hypothetical protein